MAIDCIDTFSEAKLAEVAISPNAENCYIGSPSLVNMPDGRLIASHDFFGKGMARGEFKQLYQVLYAATHLYESADHGATWDKICVLQGMHWGSLFIHKGLLYMIGVSESHGSIVIRKSEDAGRTFTEAVDSKTGLLFPMNPQPRPDGLGYNKYHCAPVPVVNHQGRIYRAFERKTAHTEFPSLFSFVLSCDAEADLLNADNWIKTEENTAEDCLEGNVIPGKDGRIYNLLRKHRTNTAWLYRVGPDHREYSFIGEVHMPGGDVKFTVRMDEGTQKYIALTNLHTDAACEPNLQRNVLGLIYSDDLTQWHVGNILIQENHSANWEESVKKYGFQYVDWIFDGENILYLSRTSYDGAHTFHNANRLTVHRLSGFRDFLCPLKTVADYGFKEDFFDASPVKNQIRGQARVVGNISFMDPEEEGGACFDGHSYLDLHFMVGNSIANSDELQISFEMNPALHEMEDGNYAIFSTAMGEKAGIHLFIEKIDGEAYLCGEFLSIKGEGGVTTRWMKPLCGQWHRYRFLIDYRHAIIGLQWDDAEVEQRVVGSFNAQRYVRSSPAFTDKIGACEGVCCYRGGLRNLLISRG